MCRSTISRRAHKIIKVLASRRAKTYRRSRRENDTRHLASALGFGIKSRRVVTQWAKSYLVSARGHPQITAGALHDVFAEPLARHTSEPFAQQDRERCAHAALREQVRQRRAEGAAHDAANTTRVPHVAQADATQHALTLGTRVRIVVADVAEQLHDPRGRSREGVEGRALAVPSDRVRHLTEQEASTGSADQRVGGSQIRVAVTHGVRLRVQGV
jgi:hypothetical protein